MPEAVQRALADSHINLFYLLLLNHLHFIRVNSVPLHTYFLAQWAQLNILASVYVLVRILFVDLNR
jgi:hypothetical protein